MYSQSHYKDQVLVLHVLKSAAIDECSMLFQFKENMFVNNHASSDSNAYPKVASWNLNKSEGTRNCCLWDGVECGSGHVIGLDLSSSFLYGTIYSNSSLFNLIHLHRLNLADNDFRFSQIPSGIGRLVQLANLNLSHSQFSGEVPKQISHLSSLVSLDLTGNRVKLQSSDFENLVQNSSETLTELFLSEVSISYEVPRSLVNSSLLTSLVMRNCGLRDYQFPTGIFNLQRLQLLDVQGNTDLTGYIPDFFGHSELKHLVVAETNFQGSLTASIGNLTSLNLLNLSSCAFSMSTLPTSISNLTQLTVLDLSSSFFSGPIPPLSSLSKLKYLNLAFNSFDRSNDCVWLGKFPDLSYLDLTISNLNCEIPSSVGNQTQIRELRLRGNGMSSQILSSVTNLTRLTVLELSDNNFTGSLRALESFSNLTYLDISGCNFDRWKLSDWFGKLNKISYLDLADVNLYGEIPSSFFNLTQVKTLDLSSNQLTGQLPSALRNLQNLKSLLLYDTEIGVAADLFLSLKKLKYLYLGSGNKMTLSVIDNVTNDTQAMLEVLYMESCNLKVIPEFLRFQHQLKQLYLDNNKIEGLIPGWMWNISKETLYEFSLAQNLLTGFEQQSPVAPWVSLQTLNLNHNMLQGLIPVPPPSIKNFFLSNNRLTGEIPPSICDSLSLLLLDLSSNKITGSIPPCFEKLSNSLLVLNLKGNNLQGTIPNIFTNESQLQMISLNENKLEGPLPRSLENCKSLQFLDIGYNSIQDTFPFWLGALPELQVLILKFNKFHGIISIPNFPKLRVMDLSHNAFFGDLPDQLFLGLPAMNETNQPATYMQEYIQSVGVYDQIEYYMWVGNYSFSMEIMNKGVTLEYSKITNILFALDLSSNKFTGKISEYVKTLTSLRLLNLSNNELSGDIPPSMGNLVNLESLDLSSNKLSGMIPQNLLQVKSLAYFNVSYNNLTGQIPQGRQFNTFSNNSYMGNDQGLCGFPLNMKCGVSKSPKASFEEEDTESAFPNGIDWVVILSGVASGIVIGLVFGNHLITRYFKEFL
ncbi:hypothetical protein QVD17_06081 [Tagetes erecta]|uniref:Leucine-rich repeat-containing N-terminal plant-type domain-containing protein n=1 Tax=Tagetes erecta TaxID=13708 RepID=A0AAD8LJG8_TARER|nr:hypothetical protein QVD17_06081 [Tagetes erecta]